MISFEFSLARYLDKETGKYTAYILFPVEGRYEPVSLSVKVTGEKDKILSVVDGSGKDWREELTHSEYFYLLDLIEEMVS